ncbi:copper chaperone PCu(A)C [Frigidibacter sp. RF13]|uniref:copper chaperone PCu(A)C n=1 Tax=Frigidibacter sp. RF13 TaxID=2997340 RepID=UPI0022712FF7|nr:copper chaperone PCu(A)C [Frigidibacter sp. RF13]MCY1127066.1 copper chaperone PCu(A)C [Frigidibacter sp. RF13]
MTFLNPAALAASLALFATAALAHDGVHIDDPYARFLPGAKSGAAFFVIENHATVDDRLVAVTSDVAEKTELHTHKMDASGMMQMGPIEGGIAIAAGESHALERGADHVMMMMLTRVPKEGEVIHLTLTFEHAGDVTVEVPVDNHR